MMPTWIFHPGSLAHTSGDRIAILHLPIAEFHQERPKHHLVLPKDGSHNVLDAR
jgi:hypothetical protein